MGIGEAAGAAAKNVGTAVTAGVALAQVAGSIAAPYLAADELGTPVAAETAVVAHAEDNASAASALYTLDEFAGDALDHQFESKYEQDVMDAAEEAGEAVDVVADFPTSQEIDPGELGDFGTVSEIDLGADFGADFGGDLGGDLGGDFGGDGGM